MFTAETGELAERARLAEPDNPRSATGPLNYPHWDDPPIEEAAAGSKSAAAQAIGALTLVLVIALLAVWLFTIIR